MIREPKWKYRLTDVKIIKVEKKDVKMREIDAIDVKMGMPFILDVSEEVSIENAQIGKTYRATIKVYTAELTPEIEKLWSEMSQKDPSFREMVEFIKRHGGRQPLFKFELVLLEPM